MRGVLLISTGIDSPVAGHLMKKQGMELIFVHMQHEKTESAKKLMKSIDKDAKLITIDHKKNQETIMKSCNPRYQCVLCKRAMYRAAQTIAASTASDYIITGENLGQVASQTVENLKILDNSVSIPVLRPLIGFDKNEIVDIARQIGTFEQSTQGSGICPYLPNSPLTRAHLDKVLHEEQKWMR